MLVIFDWDGTISDSAEKISACMQKSAIDAGEEPRTVEQIKNIIGLGLPEAVESLYPELSEQKRREIRLGYSEHFTRDDQQPSPFFPGVMETLSKLKQKGFHLAIATGKSRRGLNRVLDTLNMLDFFHGSRCADETASKPDPLMLKELLHEFERPAEQAVFIGDTEYDMAMAQALEMPRIAVSFGAHHINRLKPYAPVMCVDQFSQILDYLD